MVKRLYVAGKGQKCPCLPFSSWYYRGKREGVLSSCSCPPYHIKGKLYTEIVHIIAKERLLILRVKVLLPQPIKKRGLLFQLEQFWWDYALQHLSPLAFVLPGSICGQDAKTPDLG